jgi:hypothetical protein
MVDSRAPSAAGSNCSGDAKPGYNLSLDERVEDLTIEEFVAELGVEAFTIALLPGTADKGFDENVEEARCRGSIGSIEKLGKGELRGPANR